MTMHAAGYDFETQPERKAAYAAHLDPEARKQARATIAARLPMLMRELSLVEAMIAAISKPTEGRKVPKATEDSDRLYDAAATLRGWIYAIENALLDAAARPRDAQRRIIASSQPIFRRYAFYAKVDIFSSP